MTGSLVSSGAYDATWTWQPGNAASIGIGGVTLTSDKGTFGSIQVLPDGSITFTSGAPELSAGTYQGTGAQVHMKDAGGTQLPCGWTLDNDVTSSDGVVVHLKGSMDVIGTVFGCPGERRLRPSQPLDRDPAAVRARSGPPPGGTHRYTHAVCTSAPPAA